MHFTIIFLSAADEAIGRCDKASLPQQALFELVVEKMKMCGRFSTDEGEFQNVCSWEMTDCNENGDVTHVQWFYGGYFWPGGTIELQYLPDTVEIVTLNHTDLEGSIPDYLPSALKTITLSRNEFYGAVNLCDLPGNLENMYLKHNQLSGGLVLTNLPPTLQELDLSENQFSGEVDLTKLSPALKMLTLEDNALFGSVDVTVLPESMVSLNLGKNSFSGSVLLRSIPQRMQQMHMSGNSFQRVQTLEKLPAHLFCHFVQDEKVQVVDSLGNEVTRKQIRIT